MAGFGSIGFWMFATAYPLCIVLGNTKCYNYT